jgi:toluene monooxygenase electron transfer component
MATITIAAKNTTYECPDSDTIMRAAIRNGLGFPYECNVGSCGNCKFELVEGEVEHLRKDPPGLGPRDIARKRYLGCQARPLGDCTIKLNLRDHYKSHFLPKKTVGELVSIEDLTHDIREFRFKLADPNPFLPGQYALLSLPDVEGARAYSMCNVTDTGEEWHFEIKRVPNGACTSAMFDNLKVGDFIGLDGPYGMAYLREDAPRDIVLIAGGSGLSPMVSLVRAAAASEKLKDREIHFFYGGRNARDIYGEALLKTMPGFGARLHYHPAISMAENDPATWTGKIGFIHDHAREMLGERLRDCEIYFAGPPAMAEAVTKMIVEYKVPQAQVHFDQFF